MPKISSIATVPVPKLSDKLVGTSVGGAPSNQTNNFTLQQLKNLFDGSTPLAATLQSVLNAGNTATQSIFLTGTIEATNLNISNDSNLTNIYLSDRFYDRNNSQGTSGQYLTSTGTGVQWSTLTIGIPTLQQVLTSGNVSDRNITTTGNLQANNITGTNLIANSNLRILGTLADSSNLVGTSGQVLSSTVSGTSWVNLPSYSAVSPLLYNSVLNQFSIQQATSSQNGYLSSSDWLTFDGKQNAGNYITQLTGEASASGPGSATITLNNLAVINKTLTGLTVSGGTINSSDSILSAFGKLQNQINGVVTGLDYQGTWNASLNIPNLVSGIGTNGDYYVVDVAGGTNLDGITDWNVGDWAIFNGNIWQKLDNSESVSSVNGLTGAVVLTTTNIAEGTNLYFTQGRVSANADVSANTFARHNAVTLGTANGLSLATQQLSLGLASSSTTGALSSTDWNTFNARVGGTIATGQVAFGTAANTVGGDNGLFWDNTNKRLGVGINAPTQRLSVNGNISFAAPAFIFSHTGNIMVGQDNTGNYLFAGNNSANTPPRLFIGRMNTSIEFQTDTGQERMRIASGGNILINTTTDAGFRLDVNGTARVQGNLTTNLTAGSVPFIGASGLLSQNNTNLFWDNTNKRLGIGTNAPSNTITLGVMPAVSLQQSAATFYSALEGPSNIFSLASSSNITLNRPVFAGIRSRGTLLLPSEVLANDSILTFLSIAFDGTQQQASAGLFFDAESNASAGNAPQQINLVTGTTGANRATKLQVRSNGNVIIQNGGTYTDAGFRLDVNGTARVQGNLTTTADAVVNSVSVGRGGGAIVTNTRVGENALNANTTGSENTAIGRISMFSNTTGIQNTAVGLRSLQDNTTGSLNTSVGYQAGRFITDAVTPVTIANNSVFIGAQSRANADNQTNQIVIGSPAIGLGSNTTVIGNSSTTFGRWFGNLLIGTSTNSTFALDVNGTARVQGTVANALTVQRTTATSNIYIRYQNATNSWYAGQTDTGSFGIGTDAALGGGTLFNLTTGGNLLLGSVTNSGQRLQVTGTSLLNGLSTIQGTTASDTAPLGAELLTTGTGDASWTGTDFATGYTHVAGSTTTLTSTLAGVVNTFYQITYTVTGRTAGSFAINFGGATTAGITATGAVGPRATTTGTLIITPTSDFNGTIVLSIRVITASSASVTFISSAGGITNQIRISNNANTFIGLSAGRTNTTGVNNTFVGSSAGVSNTTGNSNSFFGISAGRDNTTASSNSFFGSSSGLVNTTGSSNSFFGQGSGQANTTGGSNSFFGTLAGASNTTGGNNSFFGITSGSANTTGAINVFFGTSAGQTNTTGNNNTFLGAFAGSGNTTASQNTVIGTEALPANSTGANNTIIGRNAGRYTGSGTTPMTSINNSVYLGFQTRGLNATGSTNEIVIGYDVVGLGSNTTVLGNTSTTHGRWYGSLLLGTTTNAASSILTMESTTQGFLPPRMTSAQRTAIASPAEGLLVIQTDGIQGLYIYINATWRAVAMI
jgi:hypothetical protein